MHIVALAWIYVVGLMAITEKSVIGGIMTFVFYCLIPLSLLWYIANSKKRATALKKQTLQQQHQNISKNEGKLESEK